MRESVQIILVQNEQIFFIKRQDYLKDFPGYYAFPGGKVEGDESRPQALKREIKEELGIDIGVGSLVDRFEDQIPELKINVYLYKVLKFEGLIEALDCKAFGFFSFGEVKRLNLAPVDKKIVDYLKKT